MTNKEMIYEYEKLQVLDDVTIDRIYDLCQMIGVDSDEYTLALLSHFALTEMESKGIVFIANDINFGSKYSAKFMSKGYLREYSDSNKHVAVIKLYKWFKEWQNKINGQENNKRKKKK